MMATVILVMEVGQLLVDLAHSWGIPSSLTIALQSLRCLDLPKLYRSRPL